jgi:hypothetical protein
MSVFHVALEQALVHFVDLLNLNQFNVSGDELRKQAQCRIRMGYPHAATKREKKESYRLSTLRPSGHGDENPGLDIGSAEMSTRFAARDNPSRVPELATAS